jgi:hypothetical protein
MIQAADKTQHIQQEGALMGIPLVVIHFYVIKPLYNIPRKLPNIVPHFMIFSKS